MRPKRFVGLLAAIAAATALIAGCQGTPKASGDTFTANGEEPDNVLIPADSTGNAGIKILDNVFAGLVSYTEDGHARMDAAESVTSADQQLWTVTVAADRFFSDGTPVTAESFVNAWKASAAQNMRATYPFGDIEGANPDGTGTLSGLAVTGERTFTIKLKHPISGFADRLGQSSFYPLPKAAFDAQGKIKTDFGKAPIGNGPYMFASPDAWVHNQSLTLVKNPKYKGPRIPKNSGFTLKFYTDVQGAYNDLVAGSLDVLDTIPPNALTAFRDELKGRAVSMPVAQMEALDVDLTVAPHLMGDREGQLRRAAISRAIDRETIIKKIFHSTREAASDFLPPMIPGHFTIPEAENPMRFDVEQAKRDWQAADQINKWAGPLKIMYNADGGHREAMEAVSHQIAQNLGIKVALDPVPDFPAQVDAMRKHAAQGLFRMGWFMGYPQADNIMTGRFFKGGSGNNMYYDSQEFIDAVGKAQRATGEAQLQAYRDAQMILARDLPSIPLWSKNVNGGWSRSVDKVRFSWNGNPAYDEIVVTK